MTSFTTHEASDGSRWILERARCGEFWKATREEDHGAFCLGEPLSIRGRSAAELVRKIEAVTSGREGSALLLIVLLSFTLPIILLGLRAALTLR